MAFKMIQIKQTERGQEILRVLFNVYFNKSFKFMIDERGFKE